MLNNIKLFFKNFLLVRKILSIKNKLIIRSGLRFHIYDSIADHEARKFFKTYLFEKINKSDKPIKILMIGSPGIQELKDLPKSELSKLKVTCVDKSNTFNFYDKLPLHEHKIIQKDVFDFFEENKEKYDIILNRWFLHHVSEEYKKTVCCRSFDILDKNGSFVIIDWFINNWKNKTDLFEMTKQFYDYRIKYFPHQKNKMHTKGRDKVSYWWDLINDNKNFSGGKHPSRNKIEEYMIEAGFINVTIEDIGDKKIIDNPFLWGHVAAYAEK